MKIGLAGPIGGEDIGPFFDGGKAVPAGYPGAPFMASLMEELLRAGNEVVAFTTSSDIREPVLLTSNRHRLSVHFAPARPHGYLYRNGSWGRAMDAFKQERRWLETAMRQARPDLVHAHWSYEFALAALDSGLPCLVTCHDAPQVVLRYMPNLYRLVRYFMARRALGRATRVTAVSPYLKEKLQNYAAKEIEVVPNPLPAACFRERDRGFRDGPVSPRLAVVLNGWNPMKNGAAALKAFAAVRGTFPAATLQLFGNDYGCNGKAMAWARQHGLCDGVNFAGSLAHGDLLDALSQADLVIHPSLEESFGMSVAEAMALGVPVLGGSASGAVPWVIGEAGLLVDVRDPEKIAQAVIAICSDSERLEKLGEAARRRARDRFSAEAVARAYLALYRGCA